MFAVLLKFISNDASTSNKAETKKKGRRTGESPAVNSMHRMDLGSSDLPPLFNLKSFFMLPKNDDNGRKINPLAIKAIHNSNRVESLHSLLLESKDYLIRNYLIEKDCKNEAYYFILENGHYDAFREYCLRTRKEAKDASNN
jgi:hypothetical protein